MPLEIRIIRPPGTPCTPQSPQVEGGSQQGPFGSDVANTSQQEPPYHLLLFDEPKDGFDQLFPLLSADRTPAVAIQAL